MIYKYRSERADGARSSREVGTLSCGEDTKTARDRFSSRNTSSLTSDRRDLLIARPPGQKRNGKLTRKRMRDKEARVYPPRGRRMGSITHAFCDDNPLARERERGPVRFSEPSIAFTSYFTHPRMVNFVQSWQRVSADRPITTERPSCAFK